MNTEVDRQLGELLETAHAVIRQQLENNDARTAMWLIDRMDKVGSKRLRKKMRIALEALADVADVEEISRQAVLRLLEGELTIDETKAIQEALGRHSALTGMVELSRLREELEELKAEAATQPKVGTAHYPTWGRLLERLNATDGDNDALDKSQE